MDEVSAQLEAEVAALDDEAIKSQKSWLKARWVPSIFQQISFKWGFIPPNMDKYGTVGFDPSPYSP